MGVLKVADLKVAGETARLVVGRDLPSFTEACMAHHCWYT